MSIINLSAPWIEHYRKIQAMFKNDPHVKVIFDAADITCRVYVTGIEKADALTEILRPELTFGNVTMKVNVIVANEEKPEPIRTPYNCFYGAQLRSDSAYIKAFYGNDALSFVQGSYGPDGTPFRYVVFAPEVVQYYNDDLGDYYGLKSTLYEDIARDIFVEDTGVFFSTDRVREKEDI